MVESQLRRRGIHDLRVLGAMNSVARERFIDASFRDVAYADDPAPIGGGQTISQPYITALMCQCLALTGTESVLEIGAGSGYHAAVLGLLAARVTTVEIVPELAELARANLEGTRLGANVTVVEADGSLGYPAMAPYDGISVAAAAPQIPAALIQQLAEGGRLVIPLGSLEDQDLVVLTRHGTKLDRRVATGCRFVPLRGRQGWHG
jgi:protein-L-isoaspartate(D-aspartate) O-methyltransferase